MCVGKRSAINESLPYIDLNSGGIAFYDGGAGTSVISFLYIVADGDASEDLDIAVNSTDVTSTVAITVPPGGAIFQNSSEFSPAVITLPKPGTEGSLGDNADIMIDST